MLVSWWFVPSHPLRIISGLKTNLNLTLSYFAHKSFNLLFYLFIHFFNFLLLLLTQLKYFTYFLHHSFYNTESDERSGSYAREGMES